MSSPPLTTTSYALLGHLAMQPWTMYDLAAQMRRNVCYFYPRAESQVYEEPKRLQRLGLASASRERAGRRIHTVYRITPAGRRALERWLAEPLAKGISLEFEGLLRVLLSPFGSDAQLRSTVEQVRADIAGLLDTAWRIRLEYLAGEAPFQRYLVHRALMHDFLCSFGHCVDQWAARSLRTIDGWPRLSAKARQAAALRTIDRKRGVRRTRATSSEPAAGAAARPSVKRRGRSAE